MKKTLKFIILFIVIALLFPCMVNAENVDSGACGDNATWTLDGNGILTIQGSGTMTSSSWDKEKVKKVVIEEGITNIKDYAFNTCSNLTEATLAESITSIGKGAFRACSALKSIVIPDSVDSIGDYAFADCGAVRNASIGADAAKALGKAEYSFRVSNNPCDLKYMYTDEGKLSDLIVISCDEDVTEVMIPDGVNVIGRSAFANNSKLISVSIPDTVTCIEDYAFNNCSSLTSIMIPECMTSLGAGALRNCGSLTSIVFPDGVTSIGEYALSGCNAVLYANIGSAAAKALGKAGYTFRISNNPCDLKYLYTDGGKLSDLVVVSCEDDATEVMIPNGVAVIDRSAFNNRSKLKNVTIPDSVTRIEDYAFNNCVSLTAITIPESVTSLGTGALRNCSSLTSVVIPDGVVDIGEYVLAETSAVRHARIGTAAAKALGKAGYSFRPINTKYDLKYDYSNGQNSPELLFVQCDDVQSIIIPDDVTIIGENAFWQCQNLAEIVVPEHVKIIRTKAFLYCKKLVSLTIPSNVTQIEEDIAPIACVMTVSDNSYAHQYALKYGFSCRVIERDIPQHSGASTVEDKVKEIILNEITDDMSQYRKAQVLHNWLVRNIVYDQSRARYSMTAESALLYGTAICDGYAAANKLLLGNIGIESDIAYGDNHSWNVVKIDGDWCHIDATFNDGWNTFAFFAVTDFALQDVENHENYSPKHQCNNYRITYAYRSGILAKIIQSWTDEISEHIRKGESSFDLAEKNDTMFGMNDRMAVQMLRDIGITVDEKHYSTAVEYELKKMEKNNCSYILHLSVTEGSTDPTPSPEPTTEPTPSPEPTTEPTPAPSPKPTDGPEPTEEPEPENKVEAYITRCYKIILGRKPDAGGLQTWYNELTSGRKTASEIIDRFVNSPEYLNKNYNYGDSVDILYQAMLGRNADAGGKANWVKKLENGQTLAHVINGFCFSKEFRGLCDSYGIKAGFVNIPNTDTTAEGKIKAFVQRCYRIILDREADPSGMQTWYEQLSSGKKAASEIIDRFVNSPEFSGKNYSPEDSVEILYKAMMGRGSDAAGKAHWVEKLKGGAPFAAVINGFCISSEFTGICASYGIQPGSVKVEPVSGMAEEEALSMLAYKAKEPITKKSETNPTRVEIINPSDTIDMNIGTAVQAVYINEEKAKEFISRCYQCILGREASTAELENWIGQMTNGTKTPDQIARGFLFSDEFKGRNVGNEALVKILYKVYMNRDADPEGLKTWTEKLDNGTSLNDLLNIFSKTSEFKKVVSEMSK